MGTWGKVPEWIEHSSCHYERKLSNALPYKEFVVCRGLADAYCEVARIFRITVISSRHRGAFEAFSRFHKS